MVKYYCMNEIINKVLKERQTVKAYSEKAIPTEDWKQVLETIYWSPTSHGFEPYRVLVIDRKNQPLRETIKGSMWGQGVVTQADKLVLFISLKRDVWGSTKFLEERTVRRLREVNGKDVDASNEEVKKTAAFVKATHLDPQEDGDHWAMKQAYIALGMAMYSASILGIGSTPMEGFERAKLEPILAQHDLLDAKTEKVAVAVAFGYPLSETSYAHWGSGKRVRDAWDKKITQK